MILVLSINKGNKFDKNNWHAGYDEHNADHLVRFQSFINFVQSGDWDGAKKSLGEIDVRSVTRAIDTTDDLGDKALHVAAREGHAHIVKELVPLMTQADMKSKNAGGDSTLHLAIWFDSCLASNKVHIVKQLGPMMGEVKNKNGNTALHYAVRRENVEVVKELVQLMTKEDLKIKNDDGYSALHLAVHKGNVSIIKEFVTKDEGNYSCRSVKRVRSN